MLIIFLIAQIHIRVFNIFSCVMKKRNHTKNEQSHAIKSPPYVGKLKKIIYEIFSFAILTRVNDNGN